MQTNTLFMQHVNLATRLVPIGLLLVLMSACQPNADGGDAEPIARIVIRTAEVASEGSADTLRVAGVTQSSREAALSFQARGRATKKNVRIGATVQAGAVLAEIANPDAAPAAQAAKQQWRAAQANLVQAQANAKRFEELFTQSAVTQQEYEAVRRTVDSAAAQERAAKANAQGQAQALAELQLRAPFAGVITADYFAEGDFVQPGQTVMRLADPSSIEIEVAVSPLVIERISQQEPVEVYSSLDASAQPVIGRIKHLSPFVSSGSVPQIVVALPAQELSPNTAVDVEFRLNSSDQLQVPLRALLRVADGAAAIYKIVDGKAQLTPVDLLSINGNMVTISKRTTGLKIGDLIATDGVAKLFDGALVEVL